MTNRQAILTDPVTYMIMGDLDKPFHRPECQCESCEKWRSDNDRPTHADLTRFPKGSSVR